ncbi:5-hydroxytryptamine receptor 4-like [Gigantopelta aegis]|uniref:5-hydroxytryptamine receptor 4-like n=1 Tax=Gigantopelta aegis TaxID=1735272 RepID=UPI001B88ADCA|nr:5-hydroxytryptamine receptor 4-like [Gigantopelta aegis]
MNNSTISDSMSHDSTLSGRYCMQRLSHMATPPPPLGTAPLVSLTIALSCIPLITVAGNLLTIVAIATYPRLHILSNAYVVSLAAADIGVAMLVMPFETYKMATNKKWMLGRHACLVMYSFSVLFCSASIYNLVCLTVDRYLAICRPFTHAMKTPRTVAMLIVISWMIPFSLSFLPIFLGWNMIGIEDIFNCVMLLTENKSCFLLIGIKFAFVVSFLGFYVPVLVMVFLNWRIYMTATKVLRQLRLCRSASDENRYVSSRDTKAAKTVCIILGCFVGCWCPFFIVLVVDAVIGHSLPYNVWTVSLWLGYFNSMMNPLLLYVFNKSFRHGFQRLFLRYGISKCLIEEPEHVSASSVVTRY